MAKIISINGKKVSPDDEEEIDSITLDPIVVSPDSKEKIKPKSLKIISTKKVPVAPRKEIEVAPERSFVEATGRKLSSLCRLSNRVSSIRTNKSWISSTRNNRREII